MTLDDEAILAAIEKNPAGQLASLLEGLEDRPLIIDEAQRSKKLALAIKQIVDENPRRGQFVLTGSSNVFATLSVTDSLAGRVRSLKLWPMTVAETKGLSTSHLLDWTFSKTPKLSDIAIPEPAERNEYVDLILKGGFPDFRNIPLKPRQAAYRDYISAVVDRDVADLLTVRKTDALRRLIDQLAIRTGAELNIAELCELIGVRRKTTEQYLDVLLRLSMVVKLGAWTSGESRREIKNAKNHFVDTGMAAALRRIVQSSFDPDATPAALGGLLESFVFNELLRNEPYQNEDIRFYHWRNQRGKEIDILAESNNRLATFEVKASTSVSDRDFNTLDWFATEGPGKRREVTSVVFYLGKLKLTFGERKFALPVSSLWSA